MKYYSNKISLVKNSRGVYCLDTSMGCASGMQQPGGCYGDCYAAKSAKLYGYDFSRTVLRHFVSEKHKRDTVLQISRIKMPFVRIGCSGDPSEDWGHAISILKVIQRANKEIVIITRHWTLLTVEQLTYLSTIKVCINTSVSALDDPSTMKRSLEQYERIKPYCKSILRIVSCDFNDPMLTNIQDRLFENDDTLDTVFRPSKTNPLVVSQTINTKTGIFNGHKALMSKRNRKTYTGKCGSCKEMCGINVGASTGRKLVTQLSLNV